MSKAIDADARQRSADRIVAMNKIPAALTAAAREREEAPQKLQDMREVIAEQVDQQRGHQFLVLNVTYAQAAMLLGILDQTMARGDLE